MTHRIAFANLLALGTVLLAGCAGGWRHGAAPGAATAPAGAPAAHASAPAPATRGPVAGGSGVTFTYQGPANTVALAGDFNDWSTSADAMTKGAADTWTLTKKLEPGRHMYKFVIDGGTWKEDPGAVEFADDGYGGKNSVVVVGAGTAGGGAAPAAPAPAAPAAPAPAAPAGAGKAPAQTAEGVVFTFAGGANAVNLAGDFNAWSTTADPMTKQADGTWTLTKKLEPGSYEYKFVINGTTWKQDEANPESKSDPYGGKNSVVTVK